MLISQLATPLRIISKQGEKENQTIVYKNKNGQYIKLSTQNKKEIIKIHLTDACCQNDSIKLTD